jgi:hypothetical protein
MFGNRRTFLARPAMAGSLRQRLAAFGALHFTSFLFTIACFLNDILR